jgi:hypothetical protein
MASQSSLDYRLMGSFERFTTKAHLNSLKRLVLVVGLAVLAVKFVIAAIWPGTAGSPLDLLARVAASLADLGAVLLVFEVLRSRRPANRATRSAVLLAVSPALLVASAVHGDPAGVAVALLLLGMYLLVDRQAPLAAGLAVGVAARVDPLVLIAAPVALAVTFPRRGSRDRQAFRQFAGALVAALVAGWAPALAWGWRAQQPPAAGGPGGLGPGWLLARPVDQGLSGFLLGPGRLLVLAAAVVPAVLWARQRPGRAYAAVGLVLLTPLALTPAWPPRELLWPLVFGYLGDARWASIYAAVAGAALLWTSAWWGPGLPWDGGVAPGAVPAGGRGAALGLATWAVLVVWVALGWRTVAVETRRTQDEGPSPPAAEPAPPPSTPARALAPPGGS